MALVRLSGLSKAFGTAFAVHPLDFEIEAGDFLAILGPSGCGKTTLLRMIGGFETPTAGRIEIAGRDVTRLGPEKRPTNMVFQGYGLFPHMNVRQNVAYGLKLKGTPRTEIAGQVEEALHLVHLEAFADRPVAKLSGGQQQRVALARALAPRPSVMLMDEPFSGLDNRLRDGIRDETLALLKEEGTSVLLVTHEPEEAMRMADQIALMRAGRIVQQGAPYNIYNAPADKAAVAFFSDINVIRSTVRGALTDTPFGQFLAPGVPDGGEVEIVFRPQHVGIDFDRGGKGPNPTQLGGTPARGVVERARFLGSESLVEFRMDFDGRVLKATVPNVFLPKPGTAMWLTVRRNRCFVFPLGKDASRR